MPYTFAPTATPEARMPFADMKEFRTWAADALSVAEGQTLNVHGTSVNDGTQEFGKLRWVKELKRPANVEGVPTHVQPGNGPSLDDVLASIDDLETDAELDEARRTGVTDDDDADEAHTPVTFESTPAEDIDAIVDWQLRNSPGARRQQTGRDQGTTRVRARRGSHANCTHATAGAEGKKARAACRKARAAMAQAS